MIEINKQLIKQVFPGSMFKQLPKPTVSQTAVNVKPGDWVWIDGQQNTYSLSGVVNACAKGFPTSDENDAMYEVFLYLSQINGQPVERED